jgi:hypothetical protein
MMDGRKLHDELAARHEALLRRQGLKPQRPPREWPGMLQAEDVPPIPGRVFGPPRAPEPTRPTQMVAVAWEKWPKKFKAFKWVRKAEDEGVGDTVERLIGPGNSAAFKAWHKRLFGRECGCETRKRLWNAQYPWSEYERHKNL